MKAVIRLCCASLLMIALFFLVGCSTTRILTSWQDNTYQTGQIKKPLIMAIAEKKIIRSRLEDEIVLNLRDMGVEAVQSYKVFPELKGLNTETIKNALSVNGLDSIMLTRLIDVKKETGYVPGTTTYSNAGSFSTYGGYYSSSMAVVSTPGYTYNFKVFTLESNLYTAQDEKLIWTALTEAEEAQTVETSLKDLAATLTADLKNKKIF